MQRLSWYSEAGFTLIETIVVIVVVGILTTVAIIRYSSSDQNQIMGAANRIISDISFAQEMAILENRGTKITFSNLFRSNGLLW